MIASYQKATYSSCFRVQNNTGINATIFSHDNNMFLTRSTSFITASQSVNELIIAFLCTNKCLGL